MALNITVQGGAGFIGFVVSKYVITLTNHMVTYIDMFTFAASLELLKEAFDDELNCFHKVIIVEHDGNKTFYTEFKPAKITNLATSSHVDRSNNGSAGIIQSNIFVTCVMLEVARNYRGRLKPVALRAFRFDQVSTGEVNGSLKCKGHFTESSNYDPNSPYLSSKASSYRLVRACRRTYGLPVIVTNCSNNYGPYRFPEKLIPLMILNAIDASWIQTELGWVLSEFFDMGHRKAVKECCIAKNEQTIAMDWSCNSKSVLSFMGREDELLRDAEVFV